MSAIGKWGACATLVAVAATAGAVMAGTSTDRQGARSTVAASGATSTAAAVSAAGRTVGVATPAVLAGKSSGQRGAYIVLYREAALAAYAGEVKGLAAPVRRTGPRGKTRMDVNGVQARDYVAYLQRVQFEHEGSINRTIGRQPQVRLRMQHAVNGMVVDLSRDEAARLRTMPEVALVEAYREYPMDTDVGPTLIGAVPVWTGTNPRAPAAYQGEGVVFGIIDSGINFGAPSFSAIDPSDGYQHANPLGAGTFLGTCQAGAVDAGRCNDKLIGGYDFVCGPPANQCGVAGIREEPGFGDTNGHGSHTASTAAGNRRSVVFRGAARNISGVAPRGNIVAFDICYTNTTTGQGLCPNVSAVAAINQSIADGVVDVFNYSIGGGAQPWTEAVSLAFLSASNAGIYVASSAGNSGPAANTLGHVEPWVSATAAAQHGRGDFAVLMEVTGPGTVPLSLQAIVVNPGAGGVEHTQAIAGTTPVVVSPGINAADDGCAAFPAGTFQGAIAVMRRGTCSFVIKTDNATAAGATAVVIANNAVGGLVPSVPATTVQVFGMLQADGNALRDFAATSTGETAGIGFPAVALPNTVDALGAFSSRGPAGTFDLVKPDMTAPGVSVLATVSGITSVTGSESVIDLYNGTSMASPHQAGAAGLIRQARPTWTVPEIKSALAMTAMPDVLLEDQVSAANPFARGSGRVRVDQAINAGLVLDETGADYLAANPANGGDVSALNQPSMAKRNCVGSCTFVRTFRNTQSTAQTVFAKVRGVSATVSPQILKIAVGGTATLRVTVDSSVLPATGAFTFGTLELESSTLKGQPVRPVLRLPIAIAKQPTP